MGTPIYAVTNKEDFDGDFRITVFVFDGYDMAEYPWQ